MCLAVISLPCRLLLPLCVIECVCCLQRHVVHLSLVVYKVIVQLVLYVYAREGSQSCVSPTG